MTNGRLGRIPFRGIQGRATRISSKQARCGTDWFESQSCGLMNEMLALVLCRGTTDTVGDLDSRICQEDTAVVLQYEEGCDMSLVVEYNFCL